MYHVMSRGDQRVHASCLVRNHDDLVLDTPGADLVVGMAWLQKTNTIRLNHLRTVDRPGHLGRPLH